MSSQHGCLKVAGLGCLGLLLLVALGVGIPAFIAWRSLDRPQVTERALGPVEEVSDAGEELLATPVTPGRVVLDLAQGDFKIRPAAAGDGVHVEARYDENGAVLEDSFEVLPDSTWIYQVRYRQRAQGLTGILRAMMGGNRGAYVHVYIPPDVPIALELRMVQGGCEVDLGGLWLTEVKIQSVQGGLELDAKAPLREPLDRLALKTTMGGLEAGGLANLAPRILEVETLMGGAELDLRGLWLRDSDIRLAVTMGGIEVRLPAGVDVRGLAGAGDRLAPATPEIPRPQLRFSVSQSMGEVEIFGR